MRSCGKVWAKKIRGRGRLGRIVISRRTGKDSVELEKRKERQKVETAEGSNNIVSTTDPEL